MQQGAGREVPARDEAEGGELLGDICCLVGEEWGSPRASVCGDVSDINVTPAFAPSEEHRLQLEMDHQSSREWCSTRLSMFAEEIWIMLLSCMTFTMRVTLSVTKMPFFKWFSHYGIQPLIMMYVSDSVLFL